MTRALLSEWTKLRTMPSTAWLLLAAVGSTVLIGAAAAESVTICPPEGCATDPVKLSLTGVWLGQAVVVVLAVLPITDEFGTGMLRSTLTADPHRLRVLLAKAGVLTSAVLGAGTLGVAGSLLAARILMPDALRPALSLSADGTLRAAAGTVLYLALVGLLALGLGTVLRDTAGAITIVLTLLYGWPTVASFVGDPEWYERVQSAGPSTAGMAIQATTGLAELPIGPWPGLGVLALYAAGALLLGGLLLRARDA